MKTKTNQFQPVSRTIQSKTDAARQAPAKQILQRYQSKTVQRQDLDEEDLLQGKFQDTAQRMELDELDEEVPLQTKESGSEVGWHGSSDSYQNPTQNNTGLPDNLKTGIESLSGFSMDDVRVHYNSGKPTQLQALAYTQGTDIHVAPGQEKHVPHEAWHVVQQKQGRVQPTMQLQGVNINDNEGLEKEADVMGGKALIEHEEVSMLIKAENLTSNIAQRQNRDIIQLAKDNNFTGILMGNHMVYSCSQPSTAGGIANLLSQLSGLTLVITGTHGDQDGNTGLTDPTLLEPDFFHQDVQTIGQLASRTVHLLPIDNIENGADGLQTIIDTGIFDGFQYDNVVLAYCHSRRTFI
ncbi:MAG: DUF4157 domain-containing protein [Tannerellaceae bacterium]|nr:DUF4157 domain-containing protein [Tannerellaceae bacterium]